MAIKVFSPSDYINYTDLNEIDNLVWKIYHEKIPTLNVETLNYSYNVKSLNQVLNSSEIYNTNNGIKYFGDMYFKPTGWKDLDAYSTITNMTADMINDWYIDIELINDNYRQILNKNIWNVNYLLIWNEDSTIEWEE